MEKSRIGRAFFALATAGVLGFGATQAFARPVASAPPGCDKYECIDYCAQTMQKGTCAPVGNGWYYCKCL